jgi:outer membrane lipoprotein-sorting protein
MTTALLIALALQGETKPQLPEAGKIFSDVLAKYAEANTAVGQITLTQTADNVKRIYNTEFQYERPNKLCIQQRADSGTPDSWLVVSNGASFAYDTPNYLLASKMVKARERLTEPAAVKSGLNGEPKILKLNDILSVSRMSLGDSINPFLQMSFQGAGDNLGLKSFLARIKKMKTSTLRKLADGSEVYVVTGVFQYGIEPSDTTSEFRRDGESYSLARFEMLVSKEMDLRKFQTVESISVMPDGSNVPVQVNIVSSWQGNIQVNAKTNEALFKLR